MTMRARYIGSQYGAPGATYGVDWLQALTRMVPAVLTDSAVVSAARLQVEKAEKGERLADYRTAENQGEMWPTSASIGDANLRIAYWLAVASRISGSKTLAATARSYYSVGLQRSILSTTEVAAELTLDVPAEVAALYTQAAGIVEKYGGSTAAPVAAILKAQASPAAIETKRAAEYQQTVVAKYPEAAVRSASDVAALGTEDRWAVLAKLPWWGWAAVALGIVAILGPFALALAPHARAGYRAAAPYAREAREYAAAAQRQAQAAYRYAAPRVRRAARATGRAASGAYRGAARRLRRVRR